MSQWPRDHVPSWDGLKTPTSGQDNFAQQHPGQHVNQCSSEQVPTVIPQDSNYSHDTRQTQDIDFPEDDIFSWSPSMKKGMHKNSLFSENRCLWKTRI